jgi:hypothetical protein
MHKDRYQNIENYNHDKYNTDDDPTRETPIVTSSNAGVSPGGDAEPDSSINMAGGGSANTDDVIHVGDEGARSDFSYGDESDRPDIFFEEDDEWPTHGPSKGIRVRLPAAALLALLIGFGGIWGGAALQRSEGTASVSSAASAFAQFRSRAGRAFAGLGGSAGSVGGGASGSSVSGTLTMINGNTLYITDGNGGIVTVTVHKTTTVTRDASANASALQPGDTVVIEGTKTLKGTISATSIASTAKGLTRSGSGGFGGGGGGFGGASG